MFNLKPVQFHEPVHQATLQAVCQCYYASDARTEWELCQLAGLPERWLLKLYSQERYNENLWYGQGFFSWSQRGTTAPQGEDTSEYAWNSPVSPQHNSFYSWVDGVT